MSYYQGRDTKKPSGGRLPYSREKRKYELGSPPIETSLAKESEVRENVRTYGGNKKIKLKEALFANVTDPSTNTTKKCKILRVKDNPCNVDYARRGIMTKGAIIETEIGTAKITSRPGQNGIINAILIK
ncbi:MAG: 30S ribosomal protein S8e [Candidatus Methanomethylicia archaeon]|jgi:small subunit ribosomal protein S8e|uniref:Small ribosomal subunit protein eS8 n=1 Tax=Thermoproteota archaeon TaxID=2056631 RepID=A0A523BEU5_9CREN|nr:30S ribosomal protein S8e [Candidatus Methanomethylicia archaeon]MCQ5340398.1 30S ribosomal protein S8e [Candidatus Methanomethylicia archaeon]NHV45401.1 30S ribosomal protein S8e [Candidatus Verstraetearchaeota archaeon]RZN56099.1 MAG: 30S ribosomal protein S8e [Candidatus Verstraetearchaeota archaeon]TDA39463.1 MAG: 30S ribosomal protein S8e [Candidatus Verstraetearchaeota archaeon]